MAPSPTTPNAAPARRELARRVFSDLSRLDRELLIMRYADGLTDPEIVAVYANALTLSEVGTFRRAAQTRFRRRYRVALRSAKPIAAGPISG